MKLNNFVDERSLFRRLVVFVCLLLQIRLIAVVVRSKTDNTFVVFRKSSATQTIKKLIMMCKKINMNKIIV